MINLDDRNKGYLATILMSFIMGMQYVFIKNVIKIANNNIFLVLSLRFSVAFIIFVIFMLWKHKSDLSFKVEKEMLLFSILNPILNFSLQTTGVMLLPVVIVSILIALIPIVNALVVHIFLKESLSKKQVVFILVCVIGAILSALSGIRNNKGNNILLGILLILCSIVSRSISQVKSKVLCERYNSTQRTFYQIYIGMIGFIILFVISLFFIPLDTKVFYDFEFIKGILYLAILATVVVFLLNNYAVTNIDVSSVGLMNNVTALISTMSGVLFLGEKLTFLNALGLIMIIFGSVMYYKSKTRGEDKV